jgi:hypothetical protein
MAIFDSAIRRFESRSMRYRLFPDCLIKTRGDLGECARRFEPLPQFDLRRSDQGQRADYLLIGYWFSKVIIARADLSSPQAQLVRKKLLT